LRAALVIVACLAAAMAQTLPDDAPLPADAEAAMARGSVAAITGLADPTPPHPDHQVWRQVLEAGQAAVEIVDHAVTQRYLARAYALTGWSVRALRAFDELVAAGHPLDVPDERLVPDVPSSSLYARVAAEQAFARYQAGDVEGAERTFARWAALDPDATEALRWLGRLASERGDPEAALPYWERLVALAPDDEAAAFSLREAQREVAVGPAAAAAFRDGIEAFELGELERAFAAFAAAHGANPDYVDAAVWAGRSALELERPETALRYWTLVTEARPDDGGAAYFRRVAQDQVAYGVTAGRAFYDGLAAYEREALDAALDAFEAAVAANDAFTQAWVWVARTRQETGRYEAAVRAWERVMALDPDDARARYFAALARQQQGVRPEAGAAFAAAVAAYETADLARARELFEEVVAIDPESATAWGWLGRVAFGERRYDDAAFAYGRAAALDPADDDLAFFAAESAALAEEARADAADDAADDAPVDADETPDESSEEAPQEASEDASEAEPDAVP
jgi:tetratricopeptide (TPR) repeat protein